MASPCSMLGGHRHASAGSIAPSSLAVPARPAGRGSSIAVDVRLLACCLLVVLADACWLVAVPSGGHLPITAHVEMSMRESRLLAPFASPCVPLANARFVDSAGRTRAALQRALCQARPGRVCLACLSICAGNPEGRWRLRGRRLAARTKLSQQPRKDPSVIAGRCTAGRQPHKRARGCTSG